MKYIKTYEVFGLSEEEKIGYSKKKMNQVLVNLKARGFDFKEAASDIMDDVWVYKGAKYIGISPRWNEKKLDIHVGETENAKSRTISLTGDVEELTGKIINFIKNKETVLESTEEENNVEEKFNNMPLKRKRAYLVMNYDLSEKEAAEICPDEKTVFADLPDEIRHLAF